MWKRSSSLPRPWCWCCLLRPVLTWEGLWPDFLFVAPPLSSSPSLFHFPPPLPAWLWGCWRTSGDPSVSPLAIRCFREWNTTDNCWTHRFHFFQHLRHSGRPRRYSGAPSVFSVNTTCWKNKIPSSSVSLQYAPHHLFFFFFYCNGVHKSRSLTILLSQKPHLQWKHKNCVFPTRTCSTGSWMNSHKS